MSHQLINHSPDLKRLRDEGFEVSIVDTYLVISGVPYVNSNKEIKRDGRLVSALTLAGDKTAVPQDHIVHFIGDFPCHRDGSPILQIKHQSQNKVLTKDLAVNHSFSNKPPEGYKDYYQKITRYVDLICHPAKSMDESVSPNTFMVIEPPPEESVFCYSDTNSSRADIGIVSEKLKNQKIAIIGVGGTGSYILDFVSKTSVNAIHVFDGDFFHSHNAFRAPGAATLDELRARPKKVDYFVAKYSKMHRSIVAHPYPLCPSNFTELADMTFVFVCLDKVEIKNSLFQYLIENKVPFIDVGIGVNKEADQLSGIVRTTMGTSTKNDHVTKRVPMTDEAENDYSKNIQIAELNALNAVMAVVRWKKSLGFYRDLEREYHTLFTIDDNLFLSEEYETQVC